MSETGSKAGMPAASEAASVSPSEIAQDGPHVVRLLPNQPPGRCTRKALPFAHEIRRLHAMGYTLEAIRQALSEVGVSVSRSTVHREANRRAAPAPLPAVIKPTDKTGPGKPVLLQPDVTQAAEARDRSKSTNTDSQSGKESAEAFFNAHHSNPLFPTKEAS